MKKMFAVLCGLVLFAAITLGVSAQEPAMNNAKPAVEKPSVSKAKKEMAPKAPKTDAEVQKCIAGKFSASEKLKPQGFNVAVSNGEATLSGTAVNAGSKGAATRIAQSCGAGKVTNSITAPAIPRPKKN